MHTKTPKDPRRFCVHTLVAQKILVILDQTKQDTCSSVAEQQHLLVHTTLISLSYIGELLIQATDSFQSEGFLGYN